MRTLLGRSTPNIYLRNTIVDEEVCLYLREGLKKEEVKKERALLVWLPPGKKT